MWTLASEAAPVLGFLNPGTVGQFLFVVAYAATVYWLINRAKAGMPVPEIRKITGLDAFEEAIGRATEMGKPVHFTPGYYAFSSETLAAFSILSYVAAQCARYDTRLIVTTLRETNHPVLEEIVRQAYLEVGRPDSFNREDVRFLSSYQFAYTAGVVGIIHREKVAANFMMGWFLAECMNIAEAGAQAGAIQIAGCPAVVQLPYLVASCDYALIGDELYAASAYLSKDPMMVGTLIGVDWFKIIIFALIVIGTIFANANNDAFSKFISL